MAVIRLLLLVVVLGGLTLLVVSNWSPVIPLVFLGIKTRPLPLAMWILMAIAAGGLTSVLISSLLNLSNHLTAQKKRKPFTAAKTTSRPSSYPKEKYQTQTKTYNSTGTDNQNKTTSKPTSNPSNSSEWENLGGVSDDWDEILQDKYNDKYEKYEDKVKRKNSETEVQEPRNFDSTTYERTQEPKTSSKSGSSYSYGYREPTQSGAGKKQSVYDADYRVIVPPSQELDERESQQSQYPKQEKNQTTDDDWEFLDDDDFLPDKKK
jgi:hypothetical protein